jgi:DNA-binding transcriptional MocR family regulator
MNFLILGSEHPDYSHPILQKHNDPELSGIQLTKEERLAKTVRMLESSAYAADIEKLRQHYQDKILQLKAAFDLHLKHYAEFHLPAAGLGAWLKLHEAREMESALPRLTVLGLYTAVNNPQFNPRESIVGIRIGFGSHGLETYEETFKYLARHFEGKSNVGGSSSCFTTA